MQNILKLKLSKTMGLIDKTIGLETNVFYKTLLITFTSLILSNIYLIIIGALQGEKFVGELSFYYSMATLISMFSLFGTENYILRILGNSVSFNRIHFLTGLYISITSMVIATIVSIIVVNIVGAGNALITYAASLTLLLSVSYVAQAKLFSGISTIYRQMLIPALSVLMAITSVMFSYKITPQIMIFICSVIILFVSFGTGVALFFKAVTNIQPSTNLSFFRITTDAYKVGISFLAFSFSFIIINTLDVIILGMFDSYKNVGTYSIATAVAAFGAIGLLSINCFSPILIRRLYYKNKLSLLNALIKRLTLFASFMLIPVFILGLLFIFIMYRHQSSYHSYLLVYVIYFAGVALNVVSGPCGFVLNMTGLSNISTKIIVQAVLLNVTVALLLVKPYGMVGVAVGATLATIYMNYRMHKSAVILAGIKPGLI